MNFSLEKTEHYTLLKTDLENLDKAHALELCRFIMRLEEYMCQYVIINFTTVTHCNAEAVRELIQLGINLNEKGGMLIISNPLDTFTRLFDKAEIIFVPTDVEAIDFVMMDQLEKQVLSSPD